MTRKAQTARKPLVKKGAKGRPPSRTMRGRLAAVAAVVVVLAIVMAMVAFALVRKPATAPISSSGAAAARKLQAVPDATLAAIGLQTSVTPPQRLRSGAPPLTSNGKPEVLYVGADYCPFCAAERWALILSLSRFGSFSGLSATHSSSTDVFPNTPTFTFHGATYTSTYLSFTGVEETTNQPNGQGGYTPLDSPTAAQVALLKAFDVAPYTTQPGAIPFTIYGNRFVSIGAGFQPSALAGLTVDQVVAKLANADDPITKDIVGSANTLVAALCETHRRSADGCLLRDLGGADPVGASVRAVTPRWLPRFTFGAALASVAVAMYLTIAHYTTPDALVCSGSGFVNCATVTTSAQSTFLGIPVAVGARLGRGHGRALRARHVAVVLRLARASTPRSLGARRRLRVVVGLCGAVRDPGALHLVHRDPRPHARIVRHDRAVRERVCARGLISCRRQACPLAATSSVSGFTNQAP